MAKAEKKEDGFTPKGIAGMMRRAGKFFLLAALILGIAIFAVGGFGSAQSYVNVVQEVPCDVYELGPLGATRALQDHAVLATATGGCVETELGPKNFVLHIPEGRNYRLRWQTFEQSKTGPFNVRWCDGDAKCIDVHRTKCEDAFGNLIECGYLGTHKGPYKLSGVGARIRFWME